MSSSHFQVLAIKVPSSFFKKRKVCQFISLKPFEFIDVTNFKFSLLLTYLLQWLKLELHTLKYLLQSNNFRKALKNPLEYVYYDTSSKRLI